MNGRYLLDTNIIIALFAEDEAVQRQINLAEEISVSIVTLGELYYGARKSAKADENMQRIDDFVSATLILICDRETACQYGAIKNLLREKDRPIPENDI
jgi:tRNA(fMet)-specific endonuclease VapC